MKALRIAGAVLYPITAAGVIFVVVSLLLMIEQNTADAAWNRNAFGGRRGL